MKEKPILFSGAMVRAILDGRKKQTRRIIKDYKITRLSSRHEFATSGPHHLSEKETPGYAYVELESGALVGLPCPYGQPGDRLWVREAFMLIDNRDGGRHIKYKAGGPDFVFRAGNGDDDWRGASKWTPSIHMRREYSRILLEITNVRVERVQDISNHDAKQEGVPAGVSPRAEFVWLWNSINAARGYGWEVNPWVWVIEFRRIE